MPTTLDAHVRAIIDQAIADRIAELSKPLLTLEEVAQRLSTSTATVRRLLAARKIRSVDIGSGGERGNQRVRRDELERFIREGERL